MDASFFFGLTVVSFEDELLEAVQNVRHVLRCLLLFFAFRSEILDEFTGPEGEGAGLA